MKSVSEALLWALLLFFCFASLVAGERDRRRLSATETVNSGSLNLDVPYQSCSAVSLNTVGEGAIEKVVVKVWYEIR